MVAIVEKKDKMKRPPMKAPRVGAVAVMTDPTHTPMHPTKIGHRRPCQSATHANRAPTIWPISAGIGQPEPAFQNLARGSGRGDGLEA